MSSVRLGLKVDEAYNKNDAVCRGGAFYGRRGFGRTGRHL
jgi:hypothetical protein